MNRKTHCRTRWWILANTKLVFLILLHQTVFENFGLFFMQLIFMYEVEKMSIAEILYRSRSRLQEIYKNLKIGDRYVNAFNNSMRLSCKTPGRNTIRHLIKREEQRLTSLGPFILFLCLLVCEFVFSGFIFWGGGLTSLPGRPINITIIKETI